MDSKPINARGGSAAAQRVRAETTRARLVAAARALFTEIGYHATGTHDVVARAGVTRGALYHHFADKAELFEAVFHETAEELNGKARSAAAAQHDGLWAKILGAFTNYLQLIAADADYQRILLIDGPAVLGWTRWRRLQSRYVAEDTAHALRLLMNEGVVVERPTEPLGNLIQAALNDAALSIAHAADPHAAGVEVSAAFSFLLEGMRLAGK